MQELKKYDAGMFLKIVDNLKFDRKKKFTLFVFSDETLQYYATYLKISSELLLQNEVFIDIVKNHITHDSLNKKEFKAINGNVFSIDVKNLSVDVEKLELSDKITTKYYDVYLLHGILAKETQIIGKTFEDLPNDVIRQMALDLTSEDIFNLCLTNKRFNKVICDDENFWRNKLKRDFPQDRKRLENESWKQFYERLKSEIPVEIPDDIDEILQAYQEEVGANLTTLLKLIKSKKLKGYLANAVFATYLSDGGVELTEWDLQKFLKLGVNINSINNRYATEGGRDNALTFATEYRNVDYMRILLENGANPNVEVSYDYKENAMTTFLIGHSALYTEIADVEQFDKLIEGIYLLLDYGASITNDMIQWVESEYVDTEYKAKILEVLRELV